MPPILRRIFWILNTFFMVPMFRLGFGPFFGNPLTGYIMVLKHIGRRSGKVRWAPVNYAIQQGNIYCVSGGRRSSDWFRNLLHTPEVEVLLPAGPVFGRAEEATDEDERARIIRRIFKNAGFAGFFEGYNPYTIPETEFRQKIADLPVLRIRPLGVANGACDPSGWVWVWSCLLTLLVVYLLLR